MPVLHAHLPYVRHPEHDFFLEENWLFEAAVDCYIPLVRMLNRLASEKVDFGLTISLSPTLLEMLSDELLIERLRRHIKRLISLSEIEVSRTKGDPGINAVARMYAQRLRDTLSAYDDQMGRDLTGAFRELSHYRGIEFITTAATHAFLPNIWPVREAVRAQVEGGMKVFERHMGFRPRGFWLPECGYCPGLDEVVMEAGGAYFFLETHGVLHAEPKPKHGIYMPIACPSGAVAFGRDPFAAERVWCAQRGYPADPAYRDFFHDQGFDESLGHVRKHLSPMLLEGESSFTGLKYRKITGHDVPKEPYDPAVAHRQALEHARDFVASLDTHCTLIGESYGFTPLVTAPYDAELLGHWWFEGTLWLEAVLRATSTNGENGGNKDCPISSITPTAYLELYPGGMEAAQPSMSSWGKGGYAASWTEPDGGRAAARILSASVRMRRIAGSLAISGKSGEAARLLNQAMRELMLAQSSDWVFMLNKGAHTGYAMARLEEHLSAFDELADMAESGRSNQSRLVELEKKHPIMHQEGVELYGRSFV